MWGREMRAMPATSWSEMGRCSSGLEVSWSSGTWMWVTIDAGSRARCCGSASRQAASRSVSPARGLAHGLRLGGPAMELRQLGPNRLRLHLPLLLGHLAGAEDQAGPPQ